MPRKTKQEFSWILLLVHLSSWSITFFQEAIVVLSHFKGKKENKLTSWHIILISYVIGKICLFVFCASKKIFNYKNILSFCNPRGTARLLSAYQQQTALRLHPWVSLKVPQHHPVTFHRWWEHQFFELEASCQLGSWSSVDEWNSKPCLVGFLKEHQSHHYSATSSDQKQELKVSPLLTCESIASFVWQVCHSLQQALLISVSI